MNDGRLAGLLAIDVILIAIAAWLALALLGLVFLRQRALAARVLFPLGAAVGLLLGTGALWGLASGPQVAVLAIGLPGLPFHLRLDSLAAFFLALLGFASAGISLYTGGYLRADDDTPPGLFAFGYLLFLASMAMVLLAADAYAFMVMWEVMALASFFLVIANHRSAETRSAGFLYLLIAHLGAIAILLCFGVIAVKAGDYSFAAMARGHLSPFWASAAFLLALLGFGAKAGVLPLHVWLPEAHPAAPTPVSALMSGLMLKTAIYGLLRVSLDLLHQPQWWWGALLLALGLATALYGVIFSTAQTDMKRLLAYSSIENVGLIFAGAGLALLFRAYGMDGLAALALTAALYQAASHAFFKSLLFLVTGSVLHATGQRNLGHLGGLIRTIPWVAWLAFIGVLASAGLPPLSGFVGEWLLLQSFLFTPGLPNGFLNMLIPVVAAVIVLVSALAGYAMVKFFGVVFLGQPREASLADARDARLLERAGLVWLAALSVALGLVPTLVIQAIDPVTRLLVGAGLGAAVAKQPWWLLVPTSVERASYGPAVFLVGGLAASAIAALLVHRLYHARLRRAAAWDCGHPWQTARMQDSAEGLGQPIRQIFEPFFRMRRELPDAFDASPHYRVEIEDHFWHGLYLPIARAVEFLARQAGRLQQGRIAVYLLYSFLTLLVLLLLVGR